MVAAATIAAMPMVHLETRACSVSRPRACAPSISNRAAVDLCGLCFFPELGLERATTPCPHSVFTTTRDADMAGDEPISWRILLLLAMIMEFLHRFLSAPGKLLSPNYTARWRWLHCGIVIRQSRSLGGVGSMSGLPERFMSTRPAGLTRCSKDTVTATPTSQSALVPWTVHEVSLFGNLD